MCVRSSYSLHMPQAFWQPLVATGTNRITLLETVDHYAFVVIVALLTTLHRGVNWSTLFCRAPVPTFQPFTALICCHAVVPAPPGLVKLFKGHVAELLRHPSGADVLDDLYNVCPQSCRNTLCAELYSREFTLFEGVGTRSENISHLGDLLAGVDARKRQAVVEHLYKGLAPVLEKALLHPMMTHRLLRELITESPGSVVADVVDTLAATGGNALKLVHTHDGAAAAAMALAYGTPKDRKRLIKGMKGYVWQTADNEWGHAVVATALSVTDDTALTGKAILGELKPHLEEMCSSKHAHRVLMQLLAPDNHRYLPPAIYELLHPPVKTMMVAADAGAAAAGFDADDGEFVDAGADAELQEQQQGADEDAMQQDGSEDSSDVEQRQDEDDSNAADAAGDLSEQGGDAAADSAGDESPQAQDDDTASPQMVERQLGESKKAADVRRRELLGSGKGSLSEALLQLCAAQGGELLRSQVGGDVVVEVARGAAGGLLWQLDQAGVERVHAAVVQELAHDCSTSKPAPSGRQQQKSKQKGQSAGMGADQQQQEQEPLLTHYFGSRHLRRLLLAGSSQGADGEGARAFAQQLWAGALKGQCKQLVGTHAEKVLGAVLLCGVPAVVQEARAELQELVGPDAMAWAAKFTGPAAGSAGAGKQKHVQTKQQQEQPELHRELKQQVQQPAEQQQEATAAAPPTKKKKKHK
eukprot:GHUV01018936.1.p1 GENE.GHUV01018936.1~~GHUV01018936.1.p1  ORF type:complete len:698 (+),score=293.25 GHUV01018936.1:365-2458(+)